MVYSIQVVKEEIIVIKRGFFRSYYTGQSDAFTLAEVLVTLLFIGIVAALVLPSLTNNFMKKTNEVQLQSFKQKFYDGFETMRLRNRLMPVYESTMDFVEAMKKDFNISRVCDSEHLSECVGKSFTAKAYDSSGKELGTKTYNSKDLTDSKSLSPTSDIESDIVGIKFADGNSAIVTRKKNCAGPSNAEINGDVYKCLGFIAFVGNGGSHSMGKDMMTNMDLVSGTYITLNPDETQEEQPKEENPYGLSFKIVAKTEYKTWDEAMAYCQGMGASLPSAEQLTEMADKIYLVEGANCTKSTRFEQPYYKECNKTIIKQQPLYQYIGGDSAAELWSSVPLNSDCAFTRVFFLTVTGFQLSGRILGKRVVCVK